MLAWAFSSFLSGPKTLYIIYVSVDLPWWLRGYSVCLQCRRLGFDSWVGKIPWRRKWQPTPVFLPGESHGRRSLVGYSPQGRKELGTTERLHLLTYLLTYVSVTPNFLFPAWKSSQNSRFICLVDYLVFLPRQVGSKEPFQT